MPAAGEPYTYTIAAMSKVQCFLRDIEALEMRAMALGLYPAARALNNAKNAVGWQAAGNIERADAAATWRA